MAIIEELISSYGSYLRKQSCTDRTIDERQKTLHLAHNSLPQGLIAPTDELDEWLWRKGLSPSSRATYYSALNGFFTWLLGIGRIDFNPMDVITRPKESRRLPNPVTDEQLAQALAHAREPFLLWIKLAAYAGCRCIDISRMHREHITEANVNILCSKGNKARAVPTHPLIWAAVQDMPDGPITDRTALQISSSAVSYLGRTLRMPGVRMHRFRHWFGTTVQRLYKDLRVTQELMGHEDPASTAGYALVVDEQMSTAVGMLPNLLAASADAAGRSPLGPALPR